MSERSSTDIQREIERTRAEMSHTIDEIQDRLSPGQIVDQLVWHLRHDGGVASSANQFAANLGRTIRDNPVPTLLIGTGLVWLMVASGRRRGRRYGYEPEEYYDEEAWIAHYGSTEEAAERYDERMGRREKGIERETPPVHAGHYGSAPGPYGSATTAPRSPDPTAQRPGVSGSTVGAAAVNPGGSSRDEGPQSASERARQAASEARERAAHASAGPEYTTHTAGPSTTGEAGRESLHETGGDWRSQGRERFEQAGESARHGMGEARRGMGRAGEYAREQTGRARHQARRRAQRAGGAFSRWFREQPLLVGALGLAVGAAIGALMPTTRRENEWLGEASDELKQRAREEAARARRIAEGAAEAAREEAKRQGLTPEGAKEELRQAQRAAGEKLKETQHEVQESIKRTAEEKLHETQHDVQESLKRTAEEKLHETEDAARGKSGEVEDRFRKVGEAAKDAAQEEAKRDSSSGAGARPGQKS